MASALKVSGEESFHQTLRQIFPGESRRESHYVRVVVAAGQFRLNDIRAMGATDSTHFVRGDGNADSRGADDNASVTASLRDGFRRRNAKVRIITAFRNYSVRGIERNKSGI